MSYDTESKSRNVLASPLGEEGHEVAKGCARVRMIMILLFCLSVLCPVHPFPLRGTSPQGETRDMERKTGESYTSLYHFGVFPLWWLSPPPCPVGSMSYDTERKSRNADVISSARRAIRNPQRRRRCRPLSEANTTLRHNLRRQPRPFFKNLRRSRHHNPRAQRARQT